jgi:toxin ParE1/3/4
MAGRSPILWSPEAEQDLFDIWLNVAPEASPATADRQLRLIDETATTLREWPFAGRDRSELLPSIRSLAAKPYVIFYRAGPSRVEIVRVLHGRRDINAIFADSE